VIFFRDRIIVYSLSEASNSPGRVPEGDVRISISSLDKNLMIPKYVVHSDPGAPHSSSRELYYHPKPWDDKVSHKLMQISQRIPKEEEARKRLAGLREKT
jgi:hypothetical protein